MLSKAKLTLSINKDVLEKAKTTAGTKRIPLSRAVENFLDFFANPKLYCFKCGAEFYSEKSKICPKCGWVICPDCEACRCSLNEETAIAVFHMRKVYEDLLTGRVK